MEIQMVLWHLMLRIYCDNENYYKCGNEIKKKPPERDWNFSAGWFDFESIKPNAVPNIGLNLPHLN